MSGPRRLWHRILDDPALSTLLLMGAYLAIVVTGLVGLGSPHDLAVSPLFGAPASVGSWMAIVGGTAGACSIPGGVWWLERGAVPIVIGAIGLRIYVLTFQWSAGATTWAEATMSAAWLTCIALGLLIRLLYIRGLALDPRRHHTATQ